MEENKNYLTQYCNLSFEWQCLGITADTASESQQKQMQELREKAIEQSGLTRNELSLISMCRKYRIFNQVNTYALRIKGITLP